MAVACPIWAPQLQMLGSLVCQKMVHGLLLIKHADELFDSCLAGMQRRLPFLKTKYCTSDLVELMHDDHCGLITPATHGGRRYFLLMVDELASKDKAAAMIKNF